MRVALAKGRKKKEKNGVVALDTLPIQASADERLDMAQLETWLWDAACAIRGATDAPKFKDFILPLVFFKRLSDVFDDEFARYAEEYGSDEVAREIVEADHLDALKEGRKPIVRFFIPHRYRWDAIRNHKADGHLGEFVTEAMREVAKVNPELQGVLDIKDYNERQSGQRTIDDDRLAALIEVISRHRLGLKNTEPDILGRAYEYLLRKFAEGQGQSAGEFYTPKEVGWLMAQLLNPEPYTTVYDPTCGSAGLLIKTRLLFNQLHRGEQSKAPRLYGQESNPVTFAMAKMNMFLHDFTDSHFAIGDTFTKPGFVAAGQLKKFDYVVANPMWNQDNYSEEFYDNDTYSRFAFGTPTTSSADLGWVQHIAASLNDTGRAAVVLDTGAVSRGSGSRSSNRERDIRKLLVESDLIEAVILLPENLFYNTTAPGVVILLNKRKSKARSHQILLVNAVSYFVKEKPKNVLTDAGIRAIAKAFDSWISQDKFSRIIGVEEIKSADYNLTPSLFVNVDERVSHRPLAAIVADLESARSERRKVEEKLDTLLRTFQLGGEPQ